MGAGRDLNVLASILSTFAKQNTCGEELEAIVAVVAQEGQARPSKAKQGFKGYPVATIAFYGPTATLATKVVVSIVRGEGHEPDPLERWFSEDTDVRNNLAVGENVVAFLKENAAKSVIVTDGLIGCPHEEGIDYPEGKSCPQCPYWAGRDRFTRERIH